MASLHFDIPFEKYPPHLKAVFLAIGNAMKGGGLDPAVLPVAEHNIETTVPGHTIALSHVSRNILGQHEGYYRFEIDRAFEWRFTPATLEGLCLAALNKSGASNIFNANDGRSERRRFKWALSPVTAATVAGLAILGFIGLVAGTTIVPRLAYLNDLAKYYRVADGKIADAFPSTHSTCSYRYSVGSREYLQTGVDCGTDPVGAAISVYYSPLNPGKSLNADPRAVYNNDLAAFVTVLIVTPLMVGGIVYLRMTRHRRLPLDSARASETA